MKKSLRISAIILAFNAAFVCAEEESTGPYLSIGQNWFNFDGDRKVSDENDLYFGLGYQVTDHLGLEVKYTDFGSEYLNISSVYRYQPRSENSFFWKAGLGKYTAMINRSGFDVGNTVVSLGAGYEMHFNDTIALALGVDSVYQPNNDFVDWVPYVGFNLFFGGSKRPAPVTIPTKPAPVDADADGVIDRDDQCPRSASGVVVDQNGCELDVDGDGIKDRFDQCPQTPVGAKVDNKGCRVILTEDVSIKLNVRFANNSDVISDDYSDEIKRIADFMGEYPDTRVVIEGHTDSSGAVSYNQKLSQKRANAVMSYLVIRFSIEPQRVSAIGIGETSPIADNSTKNGRAANRRVQAEIKTSVSTPQ